MRYLILTLTVLIMLAAGLWLWARSLGPTDAQLEALALMESPLEFEGSNAFTALWLLPYDVPESEQDGVMADDIEALVRSRRNWFEDGGALHFGSLAAERSADLRPDAEDRKLFCQSGRGSCLDQVRTNPDGIRELLQRHSRLLERTAALANHDYLQDLFPPSFLSPTPGFQLATYTQTRHALAFIDGQVEDALEGTCRDLAGWQRLGTNSDTLLTRMIGHAFASQRFTGLLADMLAELPPGHPLPPNCQALLQQPDPEALNLCQPMRGEFRLMQAFTQEMASDAYLRDSAELSRVERLRLFGFRYEPSIALAAPGYAQWCSEEIRDAVAADNPEPELLEPPSLFNLRCLANMQQCWISRMTPASVFRVYHGRHLDYGARMRLLAALLWIQQHSADESLEAAFASLPDRFQSATRPLRLDADQAELAVELHNHGDGQFFTLPLPGSRQHKAGPETG
ncbi:MAG: hypothetical protein EA370_14985 [Wenzhouxiangella sp.]|nr:MAG: hypothetical protein EA370_14985 [Wenzhouxiangella sp.]